MFIDIHELELHRIEFREEFRPAAIDLGPDIRQAEPLHSQGRAELLEEHHARRGKTIQDIRLVGNLRTRLEVNCARCLEPVGQPVQRDFDLVYRPQGIDAGQDEIAVSDPESEVGYYTGDGLLLEDVLREQLLLAVPMKTVCRQDCKGLCPQCGQNLNLGPCSCPRPEDPRWQALKDLKQKLEPEHLACSLAGRSYGKPKTQTFQAAHRHSPRPRPPQRAFPGGVPQLSRAQDAAPGLPQVRLLQGTRSPGS